MKRKSALEKHIQSSIEQFLQLHENLGHLIYQKNNTGAMRVNRPGAKSSFMRFGKKGSPDFIVWMTGGEYFDGDYLRTLFIEVKTDVGRQSDAQREFQQKVERLAGSRPPFGIKNYFVVRSLEDVQKIIL